MRISERRQRYGFLFGLGAFVLGWGLVYMVAPELTDGDTDRWLPVTWVYLSAHHIPISGLQTEGLSAVGTAVNYKQEVGVPLASAIPVLALLVSAATTADIVGYTGRFDHLISNCLAPLYGYLPALFVAYVWSAANPTIAIFVAIVFLAGVALYLGSAVVGQLAQIPFFGVTTLFGVIGVGLVILLAGASLLVALWRALLFCVGTALAGAVMMYAVRNAPR